MAAGVQPIQHETRTIAPLAQNTLQVPKPSPFSAALLQDNALPEIDPAALEAFLQANEESLLIDSHTREVMEFVMLTTSSAAFSALTEEDQNLIFRNLDIRYEAIGVVSALFAVMEQDGYSLHDSVELMRFMASGLFNYAEAREMLEVLPDMQERSWELFMFERFADRFDIADQVNSVRLVNALFANVSVHSPLENAPSADIFPLHVVLAAENFADMEVLENVLPPQQLDISAFLNPRSINESYSFIAGLDGGSISVMVPPPIFEMPPDLPEQEEPGQQEPEQEELPPDAEEESGEDTAFQESSTIEDEAQEELYRIRNKGANFRTKR